VVVVPPTESAELSSQFVRLLAVRDEVTKALDDARNAGTIGKSQGARLGIEATGAELEALRRFAALLPELFIAEGVDVSESGVAPADGAAATVTVTSAYGEKCPRCWNYRKLGADSAHPEVCERCAAVLSATE
jgi:isoleucyl-tRNA synthetase